MWAFRFYVTSISPKNVPIKSISVQHNKTSCIIFKCQDTPSMLQVHRAFEMPLRCSISMYWRQWEQHSAKQMCVHLWLKSPLNALTLSRSLPPASYEKISRDGSRIFSWQAWCNKIKFLHDKQGLCKNKFKYKTSNRKECITLNREATAPKSRRWYNIAKSYNMNTNKNYNNQKGDRKVNNKVKKIKYNRFYSGLYCICTY